MKGWFDVTVRLGLLSIGIAILMNTVGCCSHQPDRHPITVTLSENLRQDVAEVHIIAVNQQDLKKWANYPMSKYWSQDDQMKSNPRIEILHFFPGSPATQPFSPEATPDDWKKYWSLWEQDHATALVLLAKFHKSQEEGAFPDAPGSDDPRRQIVPLDRCRWEKPQQPLEFEVTSAGIRLSTPLKGG